MLSYVHAYGVYTFKSHTCAREHVTNTLPLFVTSPKQTDLFMLVMLKATMNVNILPHNLFQRTVALLIKH